MYLQRDMSSKMAVQGIKEIVKAERQGMWPAWEMQRPQKMLVKCSKDPGVSSGTMSQQRAATVYLAACCRLRCFGQSSLTWASVYKLFQKKSDNSLARSILHSVVST